MVSKVAFNDALSSVSSLRAALAAHLVYGLFKNLFLQGGTIFIGSETWVVTLGYLR